MNKNAEFIAWLKRARGVVQDEARPPGWTWYTHVKYAMFKASTDAYWATSCDKFDFIDWCNSPGRTKAEVIAMFDNSIKALEEV